MKNRLTGYPLEFWEKIKVDMPTEPPTEEDLARAYRVLSDFPSVHGQFVRVFEAIQTIKAVPERTQEHDILLQRYGALIEQIFKLSKKLSRRMDHDFEQAEKYGEEDSAEE